MENFSYCSRGLCTGKPLYHGVYKSCDKNTTETVKRVIQILTMMDRDNNQNGFCEQINPHAQIKGAKNDNLCNKSPMSRI